MAVAGLAGLAFWLAGPVAGLVVIVASVTAVLGFGLGTERRGPVEVAPTPDDEQRLLVLANGDAADGELARAVAASRVEDRPLWVHVVAPAFAPGGKRIASDVDQPREAAFERLQATILNLSGKADRVTGEVGSSDPRLALEDALRTHGADEVITLNPPESEMSEQVRAATERAVHEVPRPARQITAAG